MEWQTAWPANHDAPPAMMAGGGGMQLMNAGGMQVMGGIQMPNPAGYPAVASTAAPVAAAPAPVAAAAPAQPQQQAEMLPAPAGANTGLADTFRQCVEGLSQVERGYYLYLWQQASTDGSQRLAGKPAFDFLSKSDLGRETLRRIWTMAEYQKKGFLTWEEFAVTMKLICAAQKKQLVSLERLTNTSPLSMDCPEFIGIEPVATFLQKHPELLPAEDKSAAVLPAAGLSARGGGGADIFNAFAELVPQANDAAAAAPTMPPPAAASPTPQEPTMTMPVAASPPLPADPTTMGFSVPPPAAAAAVAPMPAAAAADSGMFGGAGALGDTAGMNWAAPPAPASVAADDSGVCPAPVGDAAGMSWAAPPATASTVGTACPAPLGDPAGMSWAAAPANAAPAAASTEGSSCPAPPTVDAGGSSGAAFDDEDADFEFQSAADAGAAPAPAEPSADASFFPGAAAPAVADSSTIGGGGGGADVFDAFADLVSQEGGGTQEEAAPAAPLTDSFITMDKQESFMDGDAGEQKPADILDSAPAALLPEPKVTMPTTIAPPSTEPSSTGFADFPAAPPTTAGVLSAETPPTTADSKGDAGESSWAAFDEDQDFEFQSAAEGGGAAAAEPPSSMDEPAQLFPESSAAPIVADSITLGGANVFDAFADLVSAGKGEEVVPPVPLTDSFMDSSLGGSPAPVTSGASAMSLMLDPVTDATSTAPGGAAEGGAWMAFDEDQDFEFQSSAADAGGIGGTTETHADAPALLLDAPESSPVTADLGTSSIGGADLFSAFAELAPSPPATEATSSPSLLDPFPTVEAPSSSSSINLLPTIPIDNLVGAGSGPAPAASAAAVPGDDWMAFDEDQDFEFQSAPDGGATAAKSADAPGQLLPKSAAASNDPVDSWGGTGDFSATFADFVPSSSDAAAVPPIEASAPAPMTMEASGCSVVPSDAFTGGSWMAFDEDNSQPSMGSSSSKPRQETSSSSSTSLSRLLGAISSPAELLRFFQVLVVSLEALGRLLGVCVERLEQLSALGLSPEERPLVLEAAEFRGLLQGLESLRRLLWRFGLTGEAAFKQDAHSLLRGSSGDLFGRESVPQSDAAKLETVLSTGAAKLESAREAWSRVDELLQSLQLELPAWEPSSCFELTGDGQPGTESPGNGSPLPPASGSKCALCRLHAPPLIAFGASSTTSDTAVTSAPWRGGLWHVQCANFWVKHGSLSPLLKDFGLSDPFRD